MWKYNYTTLKNEQYKFNMIHPKLEITRGKIINLLIDRFYTICSEANKSFPKSKAVDCITKFCWINTNDNVDPIIPYSSNGKYNTLQLEVDIKNHGFNPSDVLKKLKIEKFLHACIEKMTHIYNNCGGIDNIVFKKENNFIYYKKYNVWCGNGLYNKLNTFYDGKFSNKDVLFFCILYRYSILGGDNNQLAASNYFKNQLTTLFNIEIELFGSCFNRLYKNYCSLYYDLEKYFGSLGNFFNLEPIEGFYMGNPPFDETIMKEMVLRFIDCLDKTNKPLGFIITIPVWDFDTLKQLSTKCSQKSYTTDMGPYDAYNLLINTKYYYKHFTFCKNDFPYFDFKKNIFIKASNTYVFIIKNDLLEIDINKLTQLMSQFHFLTL